MDILLILLSLVFGPLSLLSSAVLIILHIKYRHLRKHTGSIVIPLSIGQFMFDFQWVTGYPPFLGVLPTLVCRVVSTFTVYGITVIWIYHLALTLSILTRVKGLKLSGTVVKFYHFLCHLTSVVFSVFLNIDLEEECDFKKYTCFPQNSLVVSIVFGSAFVGFFAIAVLSIYAAWLVTAKSLRYHLRISLIYSLCLSPLLIIRFLSPRIMDISSGYVLVFFIQASLVLGSATGIIIFGCRIYNKRLLKRCLNIFKRTRRTESVVEFSFVFFDSRGQGSTGQVDPDSMEIGYSLIFQSIFHNVICK